MSSANKAVQAAEYYQELAISSTDIFEHIDVAAFMRQFDSWMASLASQLNIDKPIGEKMYKRMLYMSHLHNNGMQKMHGDKSTISIGLTAENTTSERIVRFINNNQNLLWTVFSNILMIMLGDYSFHFLETYRAIWAFISADHKLQDKTSFFEELNTARETHDLVYNMCSIRIKQQKTDFEQDYKLLESNIHENYGSNIKRVTDTLARYRDEVA